MNFANQGIIVGVDPGTTVGVAILNINGELLFVGSKKNAKRNEIVNLISKFGKPLIVSADRNPPPKYVKRLASNFGAKIFFPDEDMSLTVKNRLAKKFSEEIKDSHQMDAAAAAIRAWKNYRDSFKPRKFEGFLKWLKRK